MAGKPTKEHVESLLTKYAQAYKDGKSDDMKTIREEVLALTGVTEPKKSTKEKKA